MSLVESLIVVSEKAANIARLCRSDEHLFSLLIEEKKVDEANPRFVRDFKTLADVLIQETVRHDIGAKFPGIRDNIQGEESNIFCNTLGERICVEVLSSQEETRELLSKVLDGDNKAAQQLANEVHADVQLDDVNTTVTNDGFKCDLDVEKLGIWIDPIDSTAEYISGNEVLAENGIAVSGLKCVTVLIGVYELQTGLPIIGIVNQPFTEGVDSQRWRGRCYWGISSSNSINSLSPDSKSSNIICISTSENTSIKKKLSDGGFTIIEAAGAGYKILTTIIGLADAYLLSKNSTFKWDTCGPQAILRSFQGDIISYNDLIDGNVTSINYVQESREAAKIENCCNQGGIVAYRNTDVLRKIREILKD